MPTRNVFVALLTLFPASLALGAESVPNWPAPAFWSPPGASGVTALSVTNPLAFVGVTPCRVADTRGNGFTGAYGPPSLAANATRSFTIAGVCGIDASATAVSFNFAALNVGGAGDLRVFPAGGSVPLVSTLNYNGNTPNIANAAVVPLGTGGAITVEADAVGIDLIIDVNGYYTMSSASSTFEWDTAGMFGIVGHNTAASGVSFAGVIGEAESSGVASAGVKGYELATAGTTFGVYGQTSSSGDDAAGVFGYSFANTGRTYGVYGASGSTGANAAGMHGIDATGPPVTLPFLGFTAGVLGESTTDVGVWGRSRRIGAAGSLFDTAGNMIAFGDLGDSSDSANGNYGGGTGPWGVFAGGDLGVSGVKHFVEPHPEDPNTVILYSSLEGREVGTYFRGTARTVDHRAVIEVPEDFRIVTDDEGLTVQLTPVGALTTMAVESEDLNRVVVLSAQDVTFHYLVQGVRRGYKEFQPLARGHEFMPLSADARMPAYLTEEARRRLIANGTYNADGTVNMATAQREGWTKIWADRQTEREAAAREARQARAQGLQDPLKR